MEECVNMTAKEIKGMEKQVFKYIIKLRLPVMVIDLLFKLQMICLGEFKKIFNRK